MRVDCSCGNYNYVVCRDMNYSKPKECVCGIVYRGGSFPYGDVVQIFDVDQEKWVTMKTKRLSLD